MIREQCSSLAVGVFRNFYYSINLLINKKSQNFSFFAVGVLLALSGWINAAQATVIFDNFRGSRNVPAYSGADPSYVNWDNQKHDVQIQNLIDFAAGPLSNIKSSGRATNINWLQANNTLCTGSGGACSDGIQGRVVYALVKFPVAGTYYFGAAHDDEVKVEFSTTFASMRPADYRRYDYNVPVGGVGPWTNNDSSYDTIPGNFVVSQAGACYAMRIFWNNQGGVNLLRFGWRTSTPPASPKQADYPFIPDANLRDPADPASYEDCATVETDLAIAKTGPATFAAGTKLNPGYTITLWNRGPEPMSNATLADTMPASLVVSANGFACNAYDASGVLMAANAANIGATNNGNAYAVTMRGELGVNAQDTVPTSGARLVCTVAATAIANPGNAITNTATITVNDSDPTNNTASTTSVRSDIVSVTKTGPGKAMVGEEFEYQLTVTNNSSSAKSNVVVWDQLPPGVQATAVSPSAVSCSGLNTEAALLKCTVSQSIPSKGSFSITLTVKASERRAITNYVATSPSGSGNPTTNPGPLCNTSSTSCDKASTLIVGDPALVLTKTASVKSAPLNADVNYTLTLGNTGPVDSKAPVTVVDTLPLGLGEVKVEGRSGFVCAPLLGSGPLTVTCTSTTPVAAGAQGIVVAQMSAKKTVAGTVTNTAKVLEGDTACPGASRCQASAVVEGLPSLKISKSASPVAAFVVGQPATYTITVTNEGGVPTTAETVVEDTLDPSLEIGTVNECTVAGQKVSCSIPAGWATHTPITFQIPVKPTASAGAMIDNTAYVSGGGDPFCVGEACAATVQVPVNAPKLQLTKVADPSGAFVVGQPARYVFTVTNVGNAPTSEDAVVTDSIPQGLDIKSWSTECEQPIGQNIKCRIPKGLPPHMPVSLMISVIPRVAPTDDKGLSLSNTAQVSGGGDPSCTATAPCASNEVKVPVQAPHLVVEKSATPRPFSVGAVAKYTLKVTNVGSAATTAQAVVTDTLASSLQIQVADLPKACSAQGQVVSCVVEKDLATRMPLSFVIPVIPLEGAQNTSVTNTASLVGGGDPSCTAAEPCRSNTVQVPIGAPALVITKSSNVDALVVDPNEPQSFIYTLVVTNQGAVATTADAVVSDPIPGVLKVIGVELPSACQAADGVVHCMVPKGLGENQTAEFVISVQLPAGVGQDGTFAQNQASVIGGGDPACTTATGCVSNVVKTPIKAPHLVIEKVAEEPFVVGKPANYILTVTNKGSAPTSGTWTISDTLSSLLEVAAAQLETGCNWVKEYNAVTCAFDTVLKQNESKTIRIPVTPKSEALNQVISNVAQVVGGGDPICVAPCESNTVEVTVNGPVLSVTKTASAAEMVVGQPTQYVIEVRNSGSAASADNAQLVDEVPVGLKIDKVPTGAFGTCQTSGQKVTCTLGAINPGQSAQITIDVIPTNDADMVQSNTATVTGGAPSCEGGCSSNTVTTTLKPVSEIAVSKSAPVISSVEGDQYVAHYLIEVTNLGRADSQYTLQEQPGFPDQGIQLQEWSVVTDGGQVATDLPEAPINNDKVRISADNVALARGAVHRYTVKIRYRMTPDVTNLACTDGQPGSGAFNLVVAEVGADAFSGQSCADLVSKLELPPVLDCASDGASSGDFCVELPVGGLRPPILVDPDGEAKPVPAHAPWAWLLASTALAWWGGRRVRRLARAVH